MTQTNRIALNTLASYGRSLLGLFLGLFSTRWVLTALGKEDLGLFGLMGSCIVFVTLLNGILGGTVARFFAFAIGKELKDGCDDGKENVIQWFNAAFSIHAFLPIATMLIVYPTGVHAIRHWLIIPADRVLACIWVFRMVLLSACVNMAAVPYVAMYRARQLIVELSLWDMLRTILVFVCAYLLMTWNHDRLVAYAFYMTAIPSIICVIQMIRARIAFKGCRIQIKYLFSKWHLKRIFTYAFGDFFGSLGSIIRDNGTAFLINLKFGPAVNASWGIANQVSVQTTALSSAMIGALVPAVTTSEGAGDHAKALRLSFQSIKFGVTLILLFCIPLIFEMDEVLRLWLVNPPEHTATLCRCVLVAYVIHKLGWGHQLAIAARGRIVGAQLVLGTTAASGVLLSWMMLRLGCGVEGIGYSFIATFAVMTVERAVCAKVLCAMQIKYWLLTTVAPLIVVAICSSATSFAVACLMPSSILRIAVSSFASAVVLGAGVWLIVFDAGERTFVKQSYRNLLRTLHVG